VTVNGWFNWQSGEAQGPGAYTLATLNATSCSVNAVVIVSGDVQVNNNQNNSSVILIKTQGVFMVHGSIYSHDSLVLNGNINADQLYFQPIDPTAQLVIEGTVLQIYQKLVLTGGNTQVSTTFQISDMELGKGATLNLMANSQIASVKGDGTLSIGPNIVAGIGIFSNTINIKSSGQITISGSAVGSVTLMSGGLIAQNAGQPLPINELIIFGGTVMNSIVIVQRNLTILGSVTLSVVTMEVRGNNYFESSEVMGISLAEATIHFTNTTQTVQKGQISLGGDPETSKLIMDGTWKSMGGLFNPDVPLSGSGNWTFSGASTTLASFTVIQPSNLTGNIYLKDGSTLETTASDYSFGAIYSDSTGSVVANGISLTAKTVSVNSFTEVLIKTLTIDNFNVHTAKMSCCSNKAFQTLNATIFNLGIGEYQVSALKATFGNLTINDGVTLQVMMPTNATTFQFNGGTINQYRTPFTFNVAGTTYLSGNAFKYINDDTVLVTGILDCSQCAAADCALEQGYDRIKAGIRQGCHFPTRYQSIN